MSKRLTEWFPASVKPTIPGVYELEDLPCPFCRFDGVDWCDSGTSPNMRTTEEWNRTKRLTPQGFQFHLNRRWRGLAENPEK